jgi:flagellar export protein FliJ
VSALDTLIRVHRHQLDERRQQVAELDRLSAKLREELQRLENEAAAEQKAAAASPEGGFGYGAYAASVIDRRQKLLASLAGVEEQMAQAREALAAAFQDVKRYELAAAHRLKKARQRVDRRHRIEQDEIAMQIYRRRELG